MIPLAHTADEALARLARATGSAAIAALDAHTLLGERAFLRGMTIPGLVSAGGFCRLLQAQGGWVALNLARQDDRALLPALFETSDFNTADLMPITARMRRSQADAIVARGRSMGLAIAAVDEPRAVPDAAAVRLANGLPAARRTRTAPRVLDLSALWAGPLAGHLLWLAGGEVMKVESRARPDTMRSGQPDFYALLNQGKNSVVLDLHENADRNRVLGLIAEADIVIESARPRALEQLGIDANRLVATTPGLVWLTITGHGAEGDAANWVGFGDDCAIAAGLGAAMAAVTGTPGFVGDAIGDPLTGIFAAETGWAAWQAGAGGRWGLSLRDVTAFCLAQEQGRAPADLARDLARWAAGAGWPFPPVRRRTRGLLPDFGASPPAWRSQKC